MVAVVAVDLVEADMVRCMQAVWVHASGSALVRMVGIAGQAEADSFEEVVEGAAAAVRAAVGQRAVVAIEGRADLLTQPRKQVQRCLLGPSAARPEKLHRQAAELV